MRVIMRNANMKKWVANRFFAWKFREKPQKKMFSKRDLGDMANQYKTDNYPVIFNGTKFRENNDDIIYFSIFSIFQFRFPVGFHWNWRIADWKRRFFLGYVSWKMGSDSYQS
jgi:hypothetical protein